MKRTIIRTKSSCNFWFILKVCIYCYIFVYYHYYSIAVQEVEAFLPSFYDVGTTATRTCISTKKRLLLPTTSTDGLVVLLTTTSSSTSTLGMRRRRRSRGEKKTVVIESNNTMMLQNRTRMWPSSTGTSNVPKIIDQTGFTWLPNQILKKQDKQRDGLDDNNLILIKSSDDDGNNNHTTTPVYYRTMDLDVGKSMLRILNTTRKQIVFSHFGTPIQISPKTGKMMYPTHTKNTKLTTTTTTINSHSTTKNKRPIFSNPILRYRYILDDERWLYYYKQLELFKQQFNHTRVPDTASMKKYRKLAFWVRKQRWMNTRREQGMRYNFLTDERKLMLEQINFEFDVNIGWADSYRLLKEYFQRNGHTNLSSIREDNPDEDYDDILPYWIPMQRKLYRMGKLSQDKIQLLNEIQFDWDPVQAKWEKRYDELKEFVSHHGHCRIPREGVTKSLSLWCEQQRQMYHRSTGVDTIQPHNGLKRILRLKYYHKRLRKDRIDRLNALNFEWKPLDKLWRIKYQQLLKFKEQHGHVNVPYWQPWNETNGSKKRFITNPLGVWCRSQRRQYQEWIIQQQDIQNCSTSSSSSSSMTAERIQLLEEVGFDFQYDALEEVWQCNFQDLKEFYEQHGHCRVPSGYKPNPKLANWVQQQRVQYSSSSISPERLDLLNSIQFCWAVFESLWEERYYELCEYKREYGHVNVTSKENPKLASWIGTQRKLYKEQVLRKDITLIDAYTNDTSNTYKFNLLSQLGVSLDPYQDNWMQQFRSLKKFKENHGHTRVPRFFKSDPSLGMWVSNQRRKKKDGSLSEEREGMLNELGFEWSLVKMKI